MLERRCGHVLEAGGSIELRARASRFLASQSQKLAALQDAAWQTGEPIQARLPAATKMFDISDKLSKILIHDVHALRHKFGTLLTKGSVSPGRRKLRCVTARSTS